MPEEGTEDADLTADRILARIASLTRALHDTMHELGLDKQIEEAVKAAPDARDRLRYVSTLSEQAAERVLTAIDVSKPMQDRIHDAASQLDARWAQWYEAPLERQEVGSLLTDTRAFFANVSEVTTATNAQLLEIMMAQDFQDLTGQVIKKIIEVIHVIERQLLSVLVDNIAPERREQFAASAPTLSAHDPDSLLNGPQINPTGNAEVVQGQEQVDDLLASLGF
ncbi:protein phosphatase CheZ [Trinickia violacea]|uniref:Protein phosphatase CheZ n=1 Tax=Trinickia violacea TaxID=2571746 RepID=A0A4P8IRI3_9BURK|nr:protein phosphatase CheZ [Trinickia violacea]QCP51592.1 protein phosphatase CheZ [Trinickia violacea]